MRRLHGYALAAPKADYTANVPGDARLFAGPGGASGQGAGPPHQAGGAALSASSGPHTALAPLAAARAGLGPPVQGVAGRAPTGHLDVAGLLAALAAGLGGGGSGGGGGGGGLSEADRGAVLGGGE